MAGKRYQVFVSSTSDLKEERQHVMQALLGLDYIPAGMELFPAADDDSWSLIRKVIDDCDYYIVIIGGTYGSLGPDGSSYTEMEYRHALGVGKPILAFLHSAPSKRERDAGLISKFEAFTALVRGKACKLYKDPAELGGLVAISLNRTVQTKPAPGWVRGGQPDEDTMRELLELRRRVDEAERRASDLVRGATDVGLTRAVRSQGDFGGESDWLELLERSVERVDLMGRALHGWAESKARVSETIVRKIRSDGVQFRWLVMSPENPFLTQLTEGHSWIGTDIRNKVEALSLFVRGIRDALPENMRDRIKLNYFQRVPLYFAYVRVDDLFCITPYLTTANSVSSPMFCVRDVSAAWPKMYAREFDAIWASSTPVP